MGKHNKKTQAAIEVWNSHVSDGGVAVSPALKRWVEEKVVKHIAFASGHKAWCSKCGQSFATEKTAGKEICPHCGAPLRVMKSRQAHRYDVMYVQELTAWKDYQVVRTYLVDVSRRKKEGTRFFIVHAYDWLIAEDGKGYCFSRRTTLFPNYRRIPFSLWDIDGQKPLSYKKSGAYSPWNNGWIISGHYRRRYQPWLERYGVKGRLMDEDMYNVIKNLLNRTPHFETVWKARNKVLCDAALYYGDGFQRLWAQIKIALRHGFRFKDWKLWKDHIDLLSQEGYDIFNPEYIAPKDLKRAHADLVEESNARIEREDAERERLRKLAELERSRAIKDKNSPLNVEYRKRIGRLLSVVVNSGDISIRPLQDIKDFYEEGKTLHHCVYTNKYYAEADSLILGAKVGGKRTETIELNLRTLRIEQCRGKYNQDSRYHQEIYSLMQQSAHLFRFA